MTILEEPKAQQRTGLVEMAWDPITRIVVFPQRSRLLWTKPSAPSRIS